MNNNLIKHLGFALLICFAPSINADVMLDYGQLPIIRDITISPDGKHYAFIRRMNDGNEAFLVVDVKSNKVIANGDASRLKARNVYFASNDHVIIVISQTRKSHLIKGRRWEQDNAISYNIKAKKYSGLLTDNDDLYPAQGGLSRIVGVNVEKNHAYIPAYVGPLGQSRPFQHLMRVNLDNGRGRIHARGKQSTVDWFVGQQGKVLAREDFDNKKNLHRVYSYTSGKPKMIFEQQTEIPRISFRGVVESSAELIYVSESGVGDGVYHMSLSDGAVSGPEFLQADRDIDGVMTRGTNRQFIGARISGPMPSYRYVDTKIGGIIDQVVSSFPASSVYLQSSTADLSKAIFRVSGNATASAYLLYDTVQEEISWIGQSYPNITPDLLGEIKAIRYPARDGTKIPAILTMPTGVSKAERLPLLVLPHGGPASYDAVGFDWWAQYFARRGYLVLQPNFRGSTGYGADFRVAGHGEWGRLMQDDVSDGVAVLVSQGYADPDRVCIMGASYGGYSALAGGAFTPNLYRCVISVAGVADVREMIRDTKSRAGRDHWVVSYWEDLIGDSKKERAKLKDISPANHADKFQAPVLLIHGKDDTVVPIRQSKLMQRALKKAGKEVEMVTMRGEDHWLSRSESRLQTLKEIDRFLLQHNPPG